MTSDPKHNDVIVDQFSKQAEPFARMPAHSDEDALRLCLDLAEVDQRDRVLDVACGPGILACAMAERVRHVSGIDLTPAMIEQARLRQAQKGLSNLSWYKGDGRRLPFDDGAFSLVTCRYAFHHFEGPVAMLAEMKRVCAKDGRILIIDVTPDADKQDSYDAVERLRDPSHVKAFTVEQLLEMAADLGLAVRVSGFYQLAMTLAPLLQASSPDPQDVERITRMFQDDATGGADRLGFAARWNDGDIDLFFPVSVLVFGIA